MSDRHAETNARRAAILKGAMACFTVDGIEATTIADIRRASGASTGSIYHHFGDKDGILAALYVEHLRAYHADFRRAARRWRTGEAYVKGIVRFYLRWVEADPPRARFLLDARHLPEIAPAEGTISDDTRSIYGEARARLRAFIETGEVRSMPAHLLGPLTVGVAQAAARQWIDGGAQPGLSRDADRLAAAVWRAFAP